jgi:threonine/homoserine/homoserine lactone efflux protein
MAPLLPAGLALESVIKIGLLGLVIDSSWYVSVVLVLTRGDGIKKLRSVAHRIDLFMGVLMFVFAFLLMGDYL